MTVAAEPRRLSACHRHPSADPITGFCPSCLRDRLSFLHSPSPDLRRSKSNSSAKLAASAKLSASAAADLRRKSCDVRPRTSLSHLFRSDDHNRPIVTQSNELGLADSKSGENENEIEDEEEEEDSKTMKEHIEIELGNHTKPHSSWNSAASIFTQKLQKWKIKQQLKKKKSNHTTTIDSHNVPENLINRRRSCDTEPRFSTDENPNRISFDEPRASWDGYMIARTIPRLAPMLSLIENHIIIEDETNSLSESSSSARRNSFDCSSSGKSSGKHRVPAEIDDLKSVMEKKNIVSGADTEISRISVSANKNPDSLKKRVLKILGFKSKGSETRENGGLIGDFCEKKIGAGNEVSRGRVLERESNKMVHSYHRSPIVGEIRGGGTNRSVRYSPSPMNFENNLLRFHLTPPLSSRKKKAERKSVLNLQSNARGVSRLS